MFDVPEMSRTLGLHLVSSRVVWDTVPHTPRQSTFLHDQRELPYGVVHFSTMADAAAFFSARRVEAEPGSILLVSDWNETEIRFPEGLSVFGFADSIGALHNRVEAFLRQPYEESASRQFSRFWSEINSNNNLTNDDIREAFNQLPGIEGPFAQICTVVFDSTEPSRIPYTLVMEHLLALLPHSFGVIRDNEIIIMISYQERRFDYPYDLDAITKVLEKYNGYMGIGNGTRDLSALPLLHTLIRHTVRLALQIRVGQETRIFTLERLGMYLTIDLAARGFKAFTGSDGLLYLAHPAITFLTRYDEEKDSNLRLTLYFYLLSDKSIAETAKRMHMHRNTVMYKIRKVTEMCRLDLDNPHLCERLLFSCQLARYFEEINRSKKILPPTNTAN